MKLTKSEKSWVMYDFANSVYATIMMAGIFPVFFTSIAKQSGRQGDFWWALGTTVSTLIIAVASPIVGALSDYKGFKKKLFCFFLFLGIFFTLFCAYVNSWQLMLLGYAFSHIGFSGSCLLYDSFLTDVTTPNKMDTVSSLGFGLGYIGGSTIPFVFSIAIINFADKIGITNVQAVKISIVITAVWWLVFSIPFLINVKQVYSIGVPQKNLLNNTFKSILETAKKIFKDKALFMFILSYFFYIDGVNTVITMATSYATTLGLDTTRTILALLLTQVVAFPSALIFGKLSSKYGSLHMIKNGILVYFIICLVGFFIGFGLEEEFLTLAIATNIFWFLAVLVGTVQGGIQAISRSYFGKIVPPENSGEYFGFFDIFGKFAAVVGPFLYSLVKGITGRSSFSILSIILLFLTAYLILTIGMKKYNFKKV